VFSVKADNNLFSQNTMKNHGYAFVLSPLRVDADLPYCIAPGHHLDRATDSQLQKIKPAITAFLVDPTLASAYTNDIVIIPSDKPGNKSCQVNPLKKQDWRYFVINFEGTNSELEMIQQACLVMPNDIQVGFYFMQFGSAGGEGFGWQSQSIQTFYNSSSVYDGFVAEVSIEDLQLVSETYSLLKELPSEYEHISRAFHRFMELRDILRFSELAIIGMFSIIESLLTHAPQLTESADSLTHQIRNKIVLVGKRFVRAISHEVIFGEIGEDKLWSRLYAYRSLIVHGEHVAFTRELRILKDRKTVVNFLREICKLLLITSLKEPVLMTDLKKC